MNAANRGYRFRWVIVGLSVLTLFVANGALLARSLGEDDRFDARIAENNVKIEMELQGDCPFKWVIIDLPRQLLKAGRTPPDYILQPAYAARLAYIRKRCDQATDPDTGKPFGPPPEVRTR